MSIVIKRQPLTINDTTITVKFQDFIDMISEATPKLENVKSILRIGVFDSFKILKRILDTHQPLGYPKLDGVPKTIVFLNIETGKFLPYDCISEEIKPATDSKLEGVHFITYRAHLHDKILYVSFRFKL